MRNDKIYMLPFYSLFLLPSYSFYFFPPYVYVFMLEAGKNEY